MGFGTMSPASGEVARVRGRQDQQVSMLAFVDLESRVPVGHPIRTIKRLAERGARGASCALVAGETQPDGVTEHVVDIPDRGALERALEAVSGSVGVPDVLVNNA